MCLAPASDMACTMLFVKLPYIELPCHSTDQPFIDLEPLSADQAQGQQQALTHHMNSTAKTMCVLIGPPPKLAAGSRSLYVLYSRGHVCTDSHILLDFVGHVCTDSLLLHDFVGHVCTDSLFLLDFVGFRAGRSGR